MPGSADGLTKSAERSKSWPTTLRRNQHGTQQKARTCLMRPRLPVSEPQGKHRRGGDFTHCPDTLHCRLQLVPWGRGSGQHRPHRAVPHDCNVRYPGHCRGFHSWGRVARSTTRFHRRFRVTDATGRPMRPCGECTLCCTVLRIVKNTEDGPESFPFDKPAGETCKHCKVGDGCTVFETAELPNLCRVYRCPWKLTGDAQLMLEENRPDKLYRRLQSLDSQGTWAFCVMVCLLTGQKIFDGHQPLGRWTNFLITGLLSGMPL